MTETVGIGYAQGFKDGSLAGLEIVRAALGPMSAAQMMPKRKATERAGTSAAVRRFDEALKEAYAR